MNQPWVYMRSPSWTLLPPCSPSHPSGSLQCTNPEHPVSCIEPRLAIYFTYDNMHVSMLFSQNHPLAFSHGVQQSVLYICVSFAASHIIARTWKQPRCPSTDKWIRKLRYICTMEYYLAIKKNSFASVLMRWMKLEPIIQSEVSQKEKHWYSILSPLVS